VARQSSRRLPSDLGPRGTELYNELKNGDPANDAIALEAARLADRLDDLNAIILGRGVLNLMRLRLDLPQHPEDPYTVEIKVDEVLKESRAQSLALSQLIARIRRLDGAAESKPSASAPAPAAAPTGEGLATVSPLEAARQAAGRA